MEQDNNTRKRNMLSAYGRAISFFKRILGKESAYVQRLEMEKQKLERLDPKNQAALERALGSLRAAQDIAQKATDKWWTLHQATQQHKGILDELEAELARRQGMDIWDKLEAALSFDLRRTHHIQTDIDNKEAVIKHFYKKNEDAALDISLEKDAIRDKKNEGVVSVKKTIKSNDRKKDMLEQNMNVVDRLGAIAKSHGITIDLLYKKTIPALQNIASGNFSIDDIDALIDWEKRNRDITPTAKPEDLSTFEFVNQVLIPRLDYFVTQSYVIKDAVQDVTYDKHPNLSEKVMVPYDTHKFLAETKTELDLDEPLIKPNMDFSFLLDESKGAHFERLHRAIHLVDEKIGTYSSAFKQIGDAVEATLREIEQQKQAQDKLRLDAKTGEEKNERITERQKEIAFSARAKLNARLVRNDLRAQFTGLQVAGYYGLKSFSGVPFIGGLAEAAADHITPNLGTVAALELAVRGEAQAEHEAAGKLVSMLNDGRVDVGFIRGKISELDTKIKKLGEDTGLKALEKDKTKQRAIKDAFVNKNILLFGLRVSETIRDICKPSTIDEFLASLKPDPRLHEAVTHLVFGFADSNDLSVILAESNGLSGPQKGHLETLKTIVEEVIKPNIADFYTHGSKIDFIYQSNLTGLGNSLYNARSMVRSASDARVSSLFSDSFGIKSNMGDLTVRGALDIHNIFDSTMHRHGDDMITDAKLRDGRVTGELTKKGVNVVPPDKLKTHAQLAKNATKFRQSVPEISDMFSRICGYEYFFPQAFNSAESTNIMDNPEAPASYQMVNTVVNDFIQRMSLGPIEKYREKIGDRLDNLIAATFMDFFAELGNIHAADSHLGLKKAEIKAAAKESDSFGFVFDSFTKQITNDACSRYDLFLKIYERNLAKQMEHLTDDNKALLKKQIADVRELTNGILARDEEMDPQKAKFVARLHNHTYENTTWGRKS
jgi:hypothetical protein